MRDEILTRAKRIVVKIGSSLIASRTTGLRPEQIERLADEIAALRTGGREILVVSSGAIVSGIIALAHSLRLKVVAEGVETDSQLRFLRACQCDQIQGYYFSRPLPAAEFADWVRARAASAPRLLTA